MEGLHVVHALPGRLRLRVPPGATTAGLPEAIAAEPRITNCIWTPRTRSLLILYRPEQVSPEVIAESVARHMSLDPPPDLEGLPDRPAPRVEAGAALASGVRQSFAELDHRVGRATRGLIGLAGLVPLALTVWALAQLTRGRAAPLAWSTALWYAHGLFRDYQVDEGGASVDPD